MKKKLTQKLAAYSALAAGALVISSGADAQIIYHDVNPDVTYSNDDDSLDFDFNNDAINDFQIWLNVDTGFANNVRLYPTMGNEALGSSSAGFFYPFALSSNAMISSGQTVWNGTMNGGALTLAWNYLTGGSYGNWFGATDKFLGLSFLVGTNLHYAWVKLDVAADGSSFTVKEWAYNSSPDLPILAGQTVGISENGALDAQVYAYSSVLHVNTNNDIDGKINIVNMLGQTVKEIEIIDAKMEIDLSDCDSGIYMVTIQSKSGTFAKKISI